MKNVNSGFSFRISHCGGVIVKNCRENLTKISLNILRGSGLGLIEKKLHQLK